LVIRQLALQEVADMMALAVDRPMCRAFECLKAWLLYPAGRFSGDAAMVQTVSLTTNARLLKNRLGRYRSALSLLMSTK
jgi:hypothetical protein